MYLWGIHMKGEIHIRSSHVSMTRFIYRGRDLYQEFTCIYGGIHIRRSHMSMESFISRERLISGVDMYLWSDSYLRRDSYKEFVCIDGGIYIRSSHVYVEGFI